MSSSNELDGGSSIDDISMSFGNALVVGKSRDDSSHSRTSSASAASGDF